MKLLLDTHALIWLAEDDDQLSHVAQAALEDLNNSVFYSLASIWELAIKISVGKLKMSMKLQGDFERLLVQNGLNELAIDFDHVAQVATLPFHHRDPFDRLLVVQARHEGMALVSHDAALDDYGVKRLW